MNKWSVLIVDDESIIRRGLKRALSEIHEQFYVLGTADDGETALQFLAEAEVLPDVVLTDIYMQYIDGLELIHKINQLYPSIRCVIFSGHKDFEIAKKAIDLKVIRYLNKPVQMEEFIQLFEELRKEMEADQLINEHVKRIEQMNFSGAPYIRDKLLMDIFEGRLISMDELNSFQDYFSFPLTGQFRAGVVRIDKLSDDVTKRDQLLYTVAVKHLFQEVVLVEHPGFALIQDPGMVLFGLSSNKEQDQHSGIFIFLQQFIDLSKSILQIAVKVEMGSNVEGLAQLIASLNEAYAQLGNKSMKETFDPEEEEMRLRIAFRIGDSDAVRTSAQQYAEYLVSRYLSVKDLVEQLNHLIQRMEQLAIELDVASPGRPNLNKASVNAIRMQFLQWIDGFVSLRLSTMKSAKEKKYVGQVKAYLHENFADPSLNLQKLADIALINPNYLTQEFHKATGYSCIQYLAKLRMDTAKELLSTTTFKIYEIAERVGYDNPLYFSHYFKKWVGVNPSEFKGGIDE